MLWDWTETAMKLNCSLWPWKKDEKKTREETDGLRCKRLQYLHTCQSQVSRVTAAVHKTSHTPFTWLQQYTRQSHVRSSTQNQSHDNHMTAAVNKSVTWLWYDRCSTVSHMTVTWHCCSTRKSHDSDVTAAVQWGSHMTVTWLLQYNGEVTWQWHNCHSTTKCWCHASTQSCGHLHVGWWWAAASSRPSQIRHPVCCCKHSWQNEKVMWHKHKTRVISTWLYKCIYM